MILKRKRLFVSCVYIKWLILPKKCMKTMTEVITDNLNTLRTNGRHVEQQLGHNLWAVTNKYDKEYRKRRYELIDEPIKQSHRKFIHIDLALKIIMDC